MTSCKQCSAPFEITDEDLAFYDKVSPVFHGKKEPLPPPTLCPDCRAQRRFSFRNERSLYHRKCDLTGKQLVSVYSPDKPYIVYDPTVWWSDAYDPLAYGREFDFNRPFFDQFHELNLAVPKSAIQNANSENSEFTNYSSENRNCYMAVGCFRLEDCLYCYRSSMSKDLVDCYDLTDSELCYECSQSKNLYGCTHCQHCDNCSGCSFCDNCTGCRDCFGCVNLRNAQFHIYNVSYSEEDYRKKVAELTGSQRASVANDLRALKLSVPYRPTTMINCEHCTGDQLFDCRECKDCYSLKASEYSRYCAVAKGLNHSYDANFADDSELQYESTNLHNNYHVLFAVLNWYDKEIIYNMNCFNCSHIFGCSGMKKHQYCILNKQYSKEEYEELVPRIIDHMRQDGGAMNHDGYHGTAMNPSEARGSWGEFFPMEVSPFAYNETVAQAHFPLEKDRIVGNGWKWHEEEPTTDRHGATDFVIPTDITDVSDDITQKVLRCEVTGRPYKITSQELKFYRTMHLPIPKKCPDQRDKERMALGNPRRLWERTCAKCQKAVSTSYAPDRPEIIYCEECYLKEVY